MVDYRDGQTPSNNVKTLDQREEPTESIETDSKAGYESELGRETPIGWREKTGWIRMLGANLCELWCSE